MNILEFFLAVPVVSVLLFMGVMIFRIFVRE